jgi:UDP-N-acetylglucosamine 2-epimerase (non-hydrolysing)
MAPVIRAFAASRHCFCRVLATAQHRELLDSMLSFFGIGTDIDLNVMRPAQSLPELTARLIVEFDAVLAAEAPDMVLAEGDTTTVFTAALACFYRGIPFGHVEAGLRTHNLRFPFPEEGNRVLAGALSTLHFASTEGAKRNLLGEGVNPDSIHVVGNPVIDSLLEAVARKRPLEIPLDPAKRMILVTAHRRESFGQGLENICRAVVELARRHRDVEFLWPQHPNPAVRPVVRTLLGTHPQVHLCEPMVYDRFVSAMAASALLLTDSGGVQEEGPALGKPVLVMRNESERPESIRLGVSRLVGTDTATIVREVSRLLNDPAAYAAMSKCVSPYGDGKAAGRIVGIIDRYFELRQCTGVASPSSHSLPYVSEAGIAKSKVASP